MFDWIKGLINGPVISTVTRNSLIFIGGLVVAQGWVTADEWTTISPALGALGLTVWAVIEARRNKVVFNGIRQPLPPQPAAAATKAESAIKSAAKK